MSLLAKLIMSLTGPMSIRAFEQQCRRPCEAQEQLLRHILQRNKSTLFGREHGFARIKTLRAFQKHVPIGTYESLKPYIDAELGGKGQQLTAETPVMFAMTSGTTGDKKFIPVTPESRKAKSELMRLWLSAFYKDHPGIFSDRILSIVSPEIESHAPDGTPCGSESGHAYRNVPASIRALYSLPYEVFEIDDYESRYYTILRIAAAQSLSFIATTNPSTLLVLCERLEQHSKSIIHDVRHGGISRDFKVPQPILAKIAPYLKPNPARADELARIAAKCHHKLVPKDIWPRLAAIACWQGGSVGSYLEKIRPYFPANTPIRDLGYLASELRGSVPLFDDADTGVLAIGTNVYEFFPADKDRSPRRDELLGVHEVELGKRYRVYVTTLGGLYRYDMNDIIEVVAFHHRTPMIRFVQKCKGVVSLTGEKLAESQVMAAVEQAFKSVEGKYNFISAVGEMNDGSPRYAFLTEFDRVPAASRLKPVVKALDEALCAQNTEYASKRKSLRLEPPVLRIVRRGQLDKYRQHKVANGSPDGQFKMLGITDDAEFAQEFEAIREVGLNGSSKRKPADNSTANRRRKSNPRKT